MVNFISYGNNKYSSAKKRIYNEACNTKWFNSITIYGPEMLDNNFINLFKNILELPKGGGFWIWKLNIILQELSKMKKNEILVYCDAGCHININGKKRFDEYIKMLENTDEHMISFQLEHIEKKWTTHQIFDAFDININSSIANSNQLVGGIIIMKNIDRTISIFENAIHILTQNPMLITDHYNKINQYPIFKDNRHDQSILSVIRKISNTSIIIPDETYFKSFNSVIANKYPFWATRYIN